MTRPRLASDEKIIAEAYELLMENGPRALTFESLGARIGLVPGALVRRFKTKKHLLLLVDRYGLERTNAKVNEAMERAASPIEAIIAQFTTELAFASNLDRFANGTEFLLMDFRDAELYKNYKISFEERHTQITELLKKAQAIGEIQGVDDPSELARHLEMILHGSGHVWAMTLDNTLEEYIKHHVELALDKYRRKGNGM